MSLDWDITQIHDHDAIAPWTERDDEGVLHYVNGHEGVVTEALIFYTMTVDMGAITEKNAAEFYARVHMYETLRQPSISGPDPDNPGKVTRIPITAADVQRRVGLSTNVGTKPRSAWMKRLPTTFLSEAVRAYDERFPMGDD